MMTNCKGCGCNLFGDGKFKGFELDGKPLCLPCLSEEEAAREARRPVPGNVVSIQKARPVVGCNETRKMWICNSCGGQWFWLYAGGDIQCAGCDEEQGSIRTFLPDERP